MTLPFDPQAFFAQVLQPNNIDAVFGVPDSSLSGLLSFFAATMTAPRHIVTANEGGAVALAAGYHLATKKIALCYLQNSGVSNALSPLQSLASNAVAGVPMLLMVGWRGKPGIKDEPQHALIGPRLLDNLNANNIPYEHIPETLEEAHKAVSRLLEKALAENTPVALVVPPGTYTPYKGPNSVAQANSVHTESVRPTKGATTWLMRYPDQPLPLKRESVVRSVLGRLQPKDIMVSSLGGTSRETYMVLQEQNRPISRVFFVLGAMGHAFGVASGIRLGQDPALAPVVYCLDGDGSFLMHVGNNAVLADVGPRGLVHVVVHNGVHSSTGDQPLSLRLGSYLDLAEGLAYTFKFFVDTSEALERALALATAAATPGDGKSVVNSLIVVLVGPGQSSALPRPKENAKQLKDLFVESLQY